MPPSSSASNRRRVGAYAICVQRQAILLTRLWEGDVDAGRWTLPGGGMNFGEHPEQTVLRELYEETGLHGTIRRLLDVRSHVFPAWREHGPLQAVQFIYEVEASGTPRVMEEAGSTVEAAWIPLAEMGVLPLVQLVVETQELIG